MKDAAMSRSTSEVKVHRMNETQEKLQRKGSSIKSSTAGLRYILKHPLPVMNGSQLPHNQGNPTAEEDNGRNRRLGYTPIQYKETLWENDGKLDPRCSCEVAKILERYPDKWVYRYIYKQTSWNECSPPKIERTSVSLQSLKMEFRYVVDP
ncbi:hypothetical protein LIER_06811 [Lithospermum erythrorhizon]|uniref:Uncharacterized protein n=1 Tax=Lithospermum erythrorhizon TaxID=34254 RepID=A0AAV3P672_LITER